MRAAVVIALLVVPMAAAACPVCFDADERVAWFYRLSTAFLSLLPFAIVGLVGAIAWRSARDEDGAGCDDRGDDAAASGCAGAGRR